MPSGSRQFLAARMTKSYDAARSARRRAKRGHSSQGSAQGGPSPVAGLETRWPEGLRGRRLRKPESAHSLEVPPKLPHGAAAMRAFFGRRGVDIRPRYASMLKKSRVNSTLTRQALCTAVYDCCPQLSRAKARELVDVTLEELPQALIRGEPVKLRSFGEFAPRAKRERIGRNPKTGVEAPIRARRVITFHASPVLVARVNGELPSESSE